MQINTTNTIIGRRYLAIEFINARMLFRVEFIGNMHRKQLVSSRIEYYETFARSNSVKYSSRSQFTWHMKEINVNKNIIAAQKCNISFYFPHNHKMDLCYNGALKIYWPRKVYVCVGGCVWREALMVSKTRSICVRRL